MAAALRGERGLLGDPECTSAGKIENETGIVFRHYQGSDYSILICSLWKDSYICLFAFDQQAGIHKMLTEGPDLNRGPPFGQP